MNNELVCLNTPDASHRLILLHGWGADAHDLVPIGKQLIEPISACVELVALQAPYQHPEGFGRQWYGLFPSDWAAVPSSTLTLAPNLACSNCCIILIVLAIPILNFFIK